MLSFTIPKHKIAPTVEFFRLQGAKPAGQIVARYRDQEVSDVVMDEHGQRYIFAGLVPRKVDGSYDLKGLKAGEMILEPGLVYQLIPVKSNWLT